MEAIADNGNGVYYYVDSDMEAEKIFCTDLLSTLYTVASDVKLQITFNAESVSQYRLVGYENRLLNQEDFEDDTKDAGELGAGHSVTVCYELITTDSADQNGEWMKLAIRYKNPGETKSNLNEYSIGKESLTSEPDDDFIFISAVTELSMLLHNSEYLKNSITIDTIYETLTGIETDDEYKTQFISLIKRAFRKMNKQICRKPDGAALIIFLSFFPCRSINHLGNLRNRLIQQFPKLRQNKTQIRIYSHTQYPVFNKISPSSKFTIPYKRPKLRRIFQKDAAALFIRIYPSCIAI